MNDVDFDLSKLDEHEREFYNKIKGLTDNAYKIGYMAGIKSVLGDDEVSEEGSRVRRVVVSPSMLLAVLIIVLGGIFSIGMYIGGLNG
jgi:hypothetical protein